MKNYWHLSVARAVIMRVHKPTVAYNRALQLKPQGSILYYYKNTYTKKKTINNLTRIKWNTQPIIAGNKTGHVFLKAGHPFFFTLRTIFFTYHLPLSLFNFFFSSIFFILYPFSTNFYYFPSSMLFVPSSTIFIIFLPQCFLFPSCTSTSSFILYIFPSTNTSTQHRQS